MPGPKNDMSDFMAEYEAELAAAGKAEIAAEDAAWRALPQAEKDRINAERDARWAALADAAESADDDDEADEDEDEDSDREID